MADREVKRGTLCYVTYGNQVPMILRDHDPTDLHYMKYVAPGGKLKEGEVLEQCARRETLEELGVNILTIRRAGTVFFNNEGRTFNGKAKPWDFEVEIYTGELEALPTNTKTDNGDTIEIHPREQIPLLPQHECDLEILRLIRGDRLFRRAEFIHRGEKLARMILDYE